MKRAGGLWNGLSFELVERVLSHLPVPDLCRYRTVCKKWNRLICKRKFAARCVQNSKDSDAPYVVARYYRSRGRHRLSWSEDSEPSSTDLERGVSILDLRSRRWYTVRKDDEWRTSSGILAADGGLVCQYMWEPFTPYYKLKPIFVYNPVADTRKVIPSTYLQRYLGYEHSRMAMTVDAVTLKYKIFLISAGGNGLRADVPFMLVYDSATKKWVTSSQPPLQRGDDMRICLCSVAHQDKLYILVTFRAHEHRLYSYTISQGMWEEMGVELHECVLYFPELIVSSNRLFLMTWCICVSEKDEEGKKRWPSTDRRWKLQVMEILIPERNFVTVFDMANALVLHVFGAECGEKSHNFCYPSVNAFVYRNSVILMAQISGVAIIYDMVARSWDLLPRNPVGPPSGNSGEDAYHCFAKQTNLILPTTRW